MLMSLGASAAMLVVLNRAPKGKLSIVLKAPVEVPTENRENQKRP